MADHRVEITDSAGRTMRVLVRLPVAGKASWQTLILGHITMQSGVVDTGCYPTERIAWLALYGGKEIDDDKLILNLDGFLGPTGPTHSGEGQMYARDHLVMQPGEISWRLIEAVGNGD